MTLSSPSALPIFGLAFAAGALLAIWATPYMGIATAAYALMVAGIWVRRRNRPLHRRLMFSAMGIDLTLVLVLEVQRNAIGTVIALDLTPLQLAHVLASTLAMTLYLPLIILGSKLFTEERPGLRIPHRWLGYLAFALRTAGFLLMFSLLGRPTP